MDQEILGNSVYTWLFALGAVLLGVIIARIGVGILIGIAKRTNQSLVHKTAQQLQRPLVGLGFLFGARVGAGVLVLGEEGNALFSRAFAFAVVVVLVWAIVRCYDVVHDLVLTPYAKREDTEVDLHLLLVMRTFSHVIIWILGLGSALNSAGFNVSAIIAGLGIGGLAVALAAQDTVSNIFGGIIVLTQRPFKIGDRIKVAGQNGWVMEIGLRVTKIDNWYGRRITLPNKVFTDGAVENIDTQECYYEEMRVRLEYGTNADQVERALAILKQIILDCPDTDSFHWMGLDGLVYGAPEIDIWFAVSLWQPGEKERNANWYSKIVAAKTYMNLQVMRRFEKEGLRLALPLEARIIQAPKDGNMPPAARMHMDAMRDQQQS